MEEITLEFDHDVSLDPVAELSIYCSEVAKSITSNKATELPQFHAADGHIIWPLLQSLFERTDLKENSICYELGSGLGLVTMMAATLGMRATGIEIEKVLVDKARDIAKQFQVNARFMHADIFQLPKKYYQRVDLFFGYPWPAQTESFIELFDYAAKPGALFFCYHGGLNYQILRKEISSTE